MKQNSNYSYLDKTQILIEMENESNGKQQRGGGGGPAPDNNLKSSKKSHLNRNSRPPAAAYQKVARQANNTITAGVLSDRSRVMRAVADIDGVINQEMAAKFSEGVAEIEQQIIGATISLKGRQESSKHTKNFSSGGQRNSGGDVTQTTLDHSSLIVQNTPRNGAGNPRSAINYQAKQTALDHDSQMNEQAMNPVFKHSSNLNMTTTNPNQHRSQLMNSQVANSRSKRKSMIKIMDSEERTSLIANRKSTQPDLMSGSQPEMSTVHMIKTNIPKQVNSVVDTDYRLAKGLQGSASPTQTQQLLGEKGMSGQSSAFSEHMKDKADSLSNNNMLQANMSNNPKDFRNEQQALRNSKVKSGEHTFNNNGKEPPTIMQNPYNVQSFPNTIKEKLSMVPKNILPTVAVRKAAKVPTAEEKVFKVHDLIKSDGNGPNSAEQSTIRMLQQQMFQTQAQYPSKYQDGYIQQVMRAPKMPTFEQLKRNTINRETGLAGTTKKLPNNRGKSVLVNSQRNAYATFQSSDEAFRANAYRQTAGNSSTELENSLRNFVITPGPNSIPAHPVTQHGYREKKGKLGGQQRLASQGARHRPSIASAQFTSTTTPTRASKKFAGGFGGVGSIYTHSHLTNVRKQSTSINATPGRQGAVPMKITAGQNKPPNQFNASSNNQAQFVNSAGRGSSPCSSIDVSGSDLRVAGNKTGLPQYLLDKQAQQTSYFQVREGSQQRTDHMISQDTSRSPIPIDEETFKNMNKHLPKRMEVGSLLENREKSRSNDDSALDPSSSRSGLEKGNHDTSLFTQVKPFIMSPKNLVETLRNQQKAIRNNAEQRAFNAKNSQTFKNAQLRTNYNQTLPTNQSPRNVFSQHQVWRNKPGLQKLCSNNPDDMRVQSSRGLTVDQNQKRGMVGSHQDCVTHKPNQGPNLGMFSMGVEGKSIKNPAVTQDSIKFGYSLQLLKQQQNDDLEAVSRDQRSQQNVAQAEVIINDQKEQSARKENVDQEVVSKTSLTGRSEVAIRISKINIAINEGSKPYFGQDSTFGGGGPQDEKVSQLTNYQDQEQIGGIFDSEEKFPEAEEDGKNTEREVSGQNQNPASRRFEPVLKSKSYLGHQMQTPSQGSAENYHINDLLLQDVVQSTELLVEGGVHSLIKDDPDNTGGFSEKGYAVDKHHQVTKHQTQKVQCVMDALSHQQLVCKPDTSQTSHAMSAFQRSGRGGGFQNRSRSGVGQSTSYDNEENLAPRLANKSDAIYTIHNSNVMINTDVDVNTDMAGHLSELRAMFKDDDDKSSSVYIDKKELQEMLKFDRNAWNHYQETEKGAQGFVDRKTQEFLDTMQKMGSLDHNTHASDRYSKVHSKIDRMMRDISLGNQTNLANRTLNVTGESEQMFDRNSRQMLRFRTKVPIAMIKFKSKSEKMRYIRVAMCIMAMKDTTLQSSQSEVELTYVKIFRFLADILTAQEFEQLKYYHMSRFVGNILHLAFNGNHNQKPEAQMSLRMFVCLSLDLQYMKTQQSLAILEEAHLTMTQHGKSGISNHWSKVSENKNLDVNLFSSDPNMTPVNSFGVKNNPEDRHTQIQEQITKGVHTFAHETVLPKVVRNKFFKEKEFIGRGTLNRLMKLQKQQHDIDYASLTKQSVIARNQMMTEHVVASRNMRLWRDEVAQEIHEERRHFIDRRKTKSMTHEQHATIIKRIY